MSGTTEAFARVKIDALRRVAGWNLSDLAIVVSEYALPGYLKRPVARDEAAAKQLRPAR